MIIIHVVEKKKQTLSSRVTRELPFHGLLLFLCQMSDLATVLNSSIFQEINAQKQNFISKNETQSSMKSSMRSRLRMNYLTQTESLT